MPIKIRAVDLLIINLLLENASLTNKEIADKIKRSETTVAKHRRYLVESKLIVNFTIRLDRKKLMKAIDKFNHVAPHSFTEEEYRQLDSAILINDDSSAYSITVDENKLEVKYITDVISSHRKIERNIYEFGKTMKPRK